MAAIENKKIKNEQIDLSYYGLRRAVGALGMLLPILLIVGSCYTILPSVSHYYYSSASVVFTSVLFAFGLFLITYHIEGKDYVTDNILTNIAGGFAIVVALVPTGKGECVACITAPNMHVGPDLVSVIHLLAAATFFALMGVMSIWFFTKGKTEFEENDSDEAKQEVLNKLVRNKIYRVCGWIVISGIGLLFIRFGIRFICDCPQYQFFENDVFCLEFIMMEAFGFSWLVKGKALRNSGLSYFKEIQQPPSDVS